MKLFKAILGWVLAIIVGVALGFMTYYFSNQKSFSFKDVLNKYLSRNKQTESQQTSATNAESKELKYTDQGFNLQYIIPTDSMVMSEVVSDFSEDDSVEVKKYRLIKKGSVEVKFYDASVFVASGLSTDSLSKYEITTLKTKLKKSVVGSAISGKSEDLLFGLNNVVKTKYTNSAWSSDMDLYEVTIDDKYILISQRIDSDNEVLSSQALTRLLESLAINNSADTNSNTSTDTTLETSGSSSKVDSAHSALLDSQVGI